MHAIQGYYDGKTIRVGASAFFFAAGSLMAAFLPKAIRKQEITEQSVDSYGSPAAEGG